MIRIHCIRPRDVTTMQAGPSNWYGTDVSLIWYKPEEERIISVPTVHFLSTGSTLSKFDNRTCSHLHADGDLYCLPDSWSVRPGPGAYSDLSWVCKNGVGQVSATADVAAVPIGRPWEITFNSLHHGPWTITSGPNWATDKGVPFSTFLRSENARQGIYQGTISGVGRYYDWQDTFLYNNNLAWVKAMPPISLPYINESNGYYSPSRQACYKPLTGTESFYKTLDVVWAMIRTMLSSTFVLKYHQMYSDGDRADAIVDAVGGIREVTINSLSYLRDLKRWRDLFSFIRKVKKHPLSAKAWNDAYLSDRYGLRLFVEDSLSIAKAVKKDFAHDTDLFTSSRGCVKQQRKAPFGSDINMETHVKLYADKLSTGDMDTITRLRSLDLLPSWANAWDFIPYSFVLDWLIPVGSVLARADTIPDLERFRVLEGVVSTKSTQDWKYNGLAYSGSIKTTYYQRDVLDQSDLAKALSSASVAFGDGITLQHLFDGAALLFQRK